MKPIAKIEPYEPTISDVLLRLAELAERRKADVIYRVMLKLKKDPALLDRVAQRPQKEDMQ